MWPFGVSCDLFLMIGSIYLYLFYSVLHLFYMYGTTFAWGRKSEYINWGHIGFSARQDPIAKTGTIILWILISMPIPIIIINLIEVLSKDIISWIPI